MSCCSGKVNPKKILIPDWASSVKITKVKSNKKIRATIDDLIELQKELQKIKKTNTKLQNKYCNEKLKRIMVQKNIKKFGSHEQPKREQPKHEHPKHEPISSNSMSLLSTNTNTSNTTDKLSEINSIPQVQYANPLM